MLNGDCKSHWLTNEEIKDGRKEIREPVDFFDFVARHFPIRFPVCVCVSTAKFSFFLTTLLIKTTPSNPLDEKNRKNKRKFKTLRNAKCFKKKKADQLQQHLHPYTHLISVLGRLSHNSHFVVNVLNHQKEISLWLHFLGFFFTTEIRPSERLKRQCLSHNRPSRDPSCAYTWWLRVIIYRWGCYYAVNW